MLIFGNIFLYFFIAVNYPILETLENRLTVEGCIL